MADLTKLYETRANRKQADNEGAMIKAVDIAINSALRRAGVETGFDEHYADYARRQSDEMMKSVAEIGPAFENIMGQAVRAIIQAIGGIESQDELKRMVRSIHVPDHNMSMRGLEQAIRSIVIPETNLKPVIDKLEAILAKLGEEKEEEPKEWVFNVNRDEITKLIDTVEVTAK